MNETKAMRKSALLYVIIVGAWLVLFGAAIYSTLPIIDGAFAQSAFIGVMVVITTIFIGYFWLNGTKDVAYTLFYHLWLKTRVRLPKICYLRFEPRVLMVYCTYNDFNEESLLASMRQDYCRYKVVILDDSTKPEYIQRINAFSEQHAIWVVRRDGHEGFKAGNLNHFLGHPDVVGMYDYFVILDSDEIVPLNFIRRALDYFAEDYAVGIVQANHRATRNRNSFMKKFARGVDSHWPVYQTVKDGFGFLSLLGHGAMVSKECYLATNGFPHVVAEDICFTIEARKRGFRTAFAPDISCEEEYPVDYMAFEKRHNKWTQGNMEFIRKNTVSILLSRMRWFEKLDIVLFTYSLPLTALFSVYIVINIALFPLIGYTLRYPLWWLAPTILFLVAPMLNDVVFYWRKISKYELVSYLVHATMLYGSMYYTSLRASIKSACGKSTFLVTPKDSESTTFLEAVYFNRGKLVFATVLAIVSIWASRSAFPILLLFGPAVYGLYLTVLHMKRGRGKHSAIT